MSVVVVAYGDEPWLERCVSSILASEGVTVDVVLVDNGCTTGMVDELEVRKRLEIVRPGRNLGFAGGCNTGACLARGEVLAFINQDATVEVDALAQLAKIASLSTTGTATASVRLADHPDLLNAAGNPVHILGFSWAGGFGRPATERSSVMDVASASGAAMAVHRRVWDLLGGFVHEYFAYCEDTEFSLRCWQRGLQVVYVPSAVVVHRYEFTRNPRKLYLVERNRLVSLLTLYQIRTLLLLAPVLVVTEAAMLAVALRQGWAAQKVSGWVWILRNRRWLRGRRRDVQLARIRTDRDLSHLLTPTLDPAMLALPASVALANRLLAGYWAVVKRVL